jgi:predicted 3-demethylubiquinone-9 3-methyltransferase (glyoxalase superfamily)
MKKIAPCLWFNGKAEQAMKFYKSIFKDAKVLSVYRRDGEVLLVRFRLLDQEIFGLNGGPRFKATPAFSLYVFCKTQKEVDYYWKKLLSGGGKESHCGWLTDKFGISWQICPEAMIKFLHHRDRKKSERAFQAMLKMSKLDIAVLKKAFDGK